jgi:prolyl-tRNA synthetase
MYTSHYLLSTIKETPADAEIVSHQLMMRAGLIRKLGSGLYTWMPIGLKVLKKVEAIVREEMQKAGAIEILMPSVQPAELWQESGRWEQYGGQLLKIRDRHEREFCYGPTHEEVVTDVMRRELKSYKQLPLNVFQIQTKFRDEIRPRFGVMRAREFIMKDAYSFHIDRNSLQATYDVMYQAYSNIFTRLGLKFRAVLADTGSIGGSYSHEFHVLADSGEDLIAYSNGSDYTANVELATCLAPAGERATATAAMEMVDTPTQTSIADVSEFLNIPTQQTVKTLLAVGTDTPIVALVMRGDHELQELKAEKLQQIAEPFQLADAETINKIVKCNPGFIGPVNLPGSIPIIVDRDAALLANFVCGANQDGKHLKHVSWGRDCAEPAIIADIRKVVAGDASPDGNGTLQLTRGIEVGHIFQLGDKYSQAMNATVLNEQGKSITMQMGCYGIGVSRIVGAAIEQNHDANGIIWPQAMAPFDVAIVPINYHRSEAVKQAAQNLYNQLTAQGFDVLLDDRNERPGVMFADMDLIGIPHRVVIGEKHLADQNVEYKARAASEAEIIPLNAVIKRLER